MRMAGEIDHVQVQEQWLQYRLAVRSVLGGRLSAVLMRARRALGVAELAGRDGRMIGPGCRTVMADRQRLLEQRGPSMEFAPMRENSGLGTRDLILGTCRAAAGTDGPGRGAPQKR